MKFTSSMLHTKFHDVLQLRASDVSSASPAIYTTSHTSLLPSKSCSTLRTVASSLTSRLTLVSHSRMKLKGRLAKMDQPARTWLRTDATPRLHLLEGLLDVSNTCDRRPVTNSACCICLISIAFVTLSSNSLLNNRSSCPVI